MMIFKNYKKLLLVLTFYSQVLALGFWYLLEMKLSRTSRLKACKDVTKMLYILI